MGARLHLPRPRWSFRTRIAVAIMLLLVLFSIGLVVIINVLSAWFLPHSATIGVFDARTPREVLLRTVLLSPSVRSVQQGTLHIVLMTSLLGLLVLSAIGGLGAYSLAGRLLGSIRSMAAVVQHTSAESLDHRVALTEPADELGDLARTLNGMLDRLEHAFAQQRALIMDASHELRTPLAVLRANLEVARQDPQQAPVVYARLDRALDRLDHLMGNLLLLARQEQPPSGAPVLLGPLLEEVLADLSCLAHEHKVTLRYHGDAAVSTSGEEILLMHLFRNLVENGIRYNHPGGQVTVALATQDGWATVTISDTGIGISQDKQEMVFRRFYRVEGSPRRHAGGNGLGLAIAAHVAQYHGGTITLSSHLGAGSAFTVRLPASSAGLNDEVGVGAQANHRSTIR